MTLEDWLRAYAQAWEERDPEAAAALFAEDAVYRSHRFRDPHVGRDGVRAYWRQATESQADVHVRLGQPVSQGRRTAVEWWTTLRGDEGNTTIAGCLFLRFDADGRCEELRECWHVQPGRHEPPDGWGN